MRLNKQQAYRVLGINSHATPREAKIAYLKLVKRWHPDRFLSGDRLKPKAEELIRQINLAYERVRSDMPSDQNPAVTGQGAVAEKCCAFREGTVSARFVMVQRPVSIDRHPFETGSLQQASLGGKASCNIDSAQSATGNVFDDVLCDIMKKARFENESS